MIDRRSLVMGGVTTIFVPLSAKAQRSRNVLRVVFFSVAAGPNPLADAFRRGMNELGYSEGRNLSIQYRWMAGS
jgi:putative tryptophan/tyrosine transport system substrate-binding protein